MSDSPVPSTDSALPSAPNWDSIVEDVHCPLCDYNLRGLSTSRCPECGYAFEWSDLLDPARRRHPYLYEHHSERSTWSYWRTVFGAIRPRKFWRLLQPAQRSVPGRLIRYSVVGVFLYTFFLAAGLFGPTLVLATLDARRTQMVFVPVTSTTADGAILRLQTYQPMTLTWMESINDALSTVARRFGSRLRREYSIPIELSTGWLLGTLIGLRVFGISMRRAKLNWWHMYRCVAYSFDFTTLHLPLIVGGVCSLVIGLKSSATGIKAGSVIVPFALLGLFIGGYRLYVAYRMYLRFPHPLTVVLSSQVIATLVVVILLVKTVQP